jgi:hypothetical protein
MSSTIDVMSADAIQCLNKERYILKSGSCWTHTVKFKFSQQ